MMGASEVGLKTYYRLSKDINLMSVLTPFKKKKISNFTVQNTPIGTVKDLEYLPVLCCNFSIALEIFSCHVVKMVNRRIEPLKYRELHRIFAHSFHSKKGIFNNIIKNKTRNYV